MSSPRNDSDNYTNLAKQISDACEKESARLEKIQAKHIREAFLTWTQNLLAAKKMEEAAAIKRLKADDTTPGYIAHTKKGYADDRKKIQDAINALKKNKSTALGSDLIGELSSVCSPLSSARIEGLQFNDTKLFVKDCQSAFKAKYLKDPDSNTLVSKILVIENLQGTAENEKDPLKIKIALEKFLKTKMTIMNTRRDKSPSSFWGVIDRILKSLNRTSSTMGIKSAQFSKNLDLLLFKATKKSVLQTARRNETFNRKSPPKV